MNITYTGKTVTRDLEVGDILITETNGDTPYYRLVIQTAGGRYNLLDLKDNSLVYYENDDTIEELTSYICWDTTEIVKACEVYIKIGGEK